MGFGDYPAEYNPKIHGVYDPARYYGKRKRLKTSIKWKKLILLLCNKIYTFFSLPNLPENSTLFPFSGYSIDPGQA